MTPPAADTTVPADATTPADAVAAAVLAVPGVTGLHGGRFGEVATYLPGRRIIGIRLGDTACDIHIVVAYPHHVPGVARAVHHTVAPLVSVPVTVTVEDVAELPTGMDEKGTTP